MSLQASLQPAIDAALTGTTTAASLTFTGNAQFRKRGRVFCPGVSPGFEQYKSDFAAQVNQWDGTSFTGSTSSAGFSGGEIKFTTANNASNTNTDRLFCGPKSPYYAIEFDVIVTPGSASAAIIEVGIQNAGDSNVFSDFLVAGFNVVGNSVFVNYKGSNVTTPTSFTPDAAIGGSYNLSFCFRQNGPYVAAFYRNNDTSAVGVKGWRYITSVDVSGSVDMTLASNLSAYRYCFGHNITNSSGQATIRYLAVRAGPCGMSGATAFQPITYEDGTPYRDGPWMYATTCNNGFAPATGSTNINNNRSCHAGVVRIHQDTLEVQETSKLFFQCTVSGVSHVFGDNDWCCVFDRQAGGFQILVTPWSDATNGGSGGSLLMPRVGLWGGLARKDILHGAHVLSLTNMLSIFPYASTPTTTANQPEDPSLVQIAGTWYCAQTAGAMHLFSATPNGGSITGLTWTRVATVAGTGNIIEGSRLAKIGGQWRVLAACSDFSPPYICYDLTLSNRAGVAAPNPNSGMAVGGGIAPHTNIFPRYRDGDTTYLFITFDYSTFMGQDYAVGDYYIYESSQSNAGFEFNPAPLMTGGIPSPARATEAA